MADAPDVPITPCNSSSPEEEKKPKCPVVGIGASAGGLEAFKAFFQGMPPNSGMIFVLIQHLSLDYPSIMAELLSSCTAMPVRQVTEEVELEPDHVYVIAPNTVLTIAECTLKVTAAGNLTGPRMVIDHFFHTLAEDQGENAVGVLLSGAGSDGALGLQSIKQHGGFTLIQKLDTCRYESMPRAALTLGMVDHELPVEDMPSKLITFFEYRAELAAKGGPDGIRDDVLGHIGRLCSLLGERLGHDFSRYKQNTVVRRVQRRMNLLRISPASAYVEYVERDPNEAELLFKDMLISVTEFFRDQDAFEMLARRVIPRLVQGEEASGTIRIWVPGCATGQEAYSLAILLKEQMSRVETKKPVQIFATDIDEAALEVARQARYSDELVEQISRERLSKFFIRRDGAWQLSKEVREMCIFSTHNLITDPPFSRMDLVSCRNVLIYFDSSLQQKVIPLFHYALKPGGFLSLGPSESLGIHADAFLAIDKTLRIYQARASTACMAVRLPRIGNGRSNRIVVDTSPRMRAASHRDARDVHERGMLEWYSPPSILINTDGEILHFIRQTTRYLEHPVGNPTQNVFELVRDDLRVPLRAALHEVKVSGEEFVREDLEVETGHELQRLSLIVRPIKEAGAEPERFLIVFLEHGKPRVKGVPVIALENTNYRGSDSAVVQELERELRVTKESLQATIEELENSNEELKSGNEELVSVNEEYQSANESLQTSKEELQSLNEELETVNNELIKKVDELDRANVDMQNFFASTQIATLFLDPALRIQKFTPAATGLFHLIESDLGRPLLDISARFDRKPLFAEIQRVNEGEPARHLDVSVPEKGEWYIARVLPYRTSERVSEGVVVTFHDVTEGKRNEEALQRAVNENEELHQIGLAFSVERDIQPLLQKITAVATRLTGAQFGAFFYNTTDEEGNAYTLYTISGVPRETFDRFPMPRATQVFAPTFHGDGPVRSDDITKDPRYGNNSPFKGMPEGHLPVVSYLAISVKSTTDDVIGGLFFGHQEAGVFDAHSERIAVGIAAQAGVALDNASLIDILRRNSHALQQSEEHFRLLANAMPQIVWIARPDGSVEYFNERWYEFTGFTRSGSQNEVWEPVMHPDDLARTVVTWTHSLQTGEPYDIRYRFRDPRTLEYRWFLGRALPVRDESGVITRWFGTCTDIDELHRAEAALQEAAQHKDEFLAMLGHELRNPLAPIQNGLQIMELSDTTPEVATDLRGMMKRQVRHLTRIVDDLLDVSRISRGKILLRTELLDFVEITRAALEDYRGTIETNQLSLSTDLPGFPCLIEGDHTRVCQIISNLIHNACKFTDPGGTIHVQLHQSETTAVLTLRDSGIGMSRQTLHRIFEPFAQADTSLDRSRGGLGLGLALVRALVELHRGTVVVDSAGIGEGTIVTVSMPIAAAKSAPLQKLDIKQPGAPCAIVLVEDNVDAARTLALLLRRRGHQVVTAENGRDGVAAVLMAPTDVLVCDIGLPGELDGYEVARTLRAAPAHTPSLMIALSGYGQEQDQRMALNAGFDLHLTKPVDVDALITVIANHLT
ncbi:MAG: histidine kinase [Chthoniobacteraceae bacterium]|nr:histidine kinase [Chthoniobacteraceae bacterium]